MGILAVAQQWSFDLQGICLLLLVADCGGLMQSDSNEIAQISFYLAKPGRTFATVLDPENKIGPAKAVKIHDFVVEGAECRFIYFESTSAKKNPPWLDFANDKLEPDQRITFSATSKSANGIFLIKIEERIFAATFGRSASSHLYDRALESDFGIKTAMNMCGNEEIRQTKSQSNSITPTHIDRQVSKPSDAFSFGLSEAEDLKYISAHMKGDNNITLQGRDSLTVKVIGKNKLNWESLVNRCKTFLKEYDSKAFIELFPNYKNFRPATEAEGSALDALLIAELKAKNFSKITLSVPEFVSEEDFGFSYTNNNVTDNSVFAYLDAKQLNECFKLEKITIEKLKAKKIFAYSPAENKVLSYKKWYVYSCLVFEQKFAGKYFILSDGRWSEVDPEFYKAIVNFVANTLREEPHEPIYGGIDISDDKKKKNREAIFNAKVCEIRPSNVLFDLAKLKIGNGRKDKEFCDILDLQDDDVVRIVNCKPYKDATSINYLFSQAKFYCDAFLHDEIFLSEIRGHIEKSASPVKQKYLDYIAEKTEDLHGSKFRLCLWLLYDQSEKTVPTKNDIPLIAQYELKLMHDHLRKVCKVRDIILRFVPVKTKNYKTNVSPKKAA